jgi:hypothetical protein
MIRKALLEYVLLMAFVALTSAALFQVKPVQRRAAESTAGTYPADIQPALPFDCPIPPGVDPAGVPCQP